MNFEELCISANGKTIIFDPVNSHTATHFNDKPGLKDLAIEFLCKSELNGDIVAKDVDMGRVIGNSSVVDTDDTDEIVYALRRNREDQGYVPFTKSRSPQPSQLLSIHLESRGDDVYELSSVWIGEFDSPYFPQMPNAPAESVYYWSKHAFVWGSQEIIPGTETSTRPW